MNSYEILNRRTPQHLPESHTRRTEEPILLTEEELQMYDLNFADPVGNPGHDGAGNMILSKNMRLAVNEKHSGRSLSTIVYGDHSSGAFSEPNILQADMSYVIEDEDGRYFNAYSQYLKKKGYDAFSIILCRTRMSVSDIVKELAVFDTKKSAFFLIHSPYESEENWKKLTKIMEGAIKAISQQNAGKNPAPCMHTSIMMPHFYRIPAMPMLLYDEGLGMLAMMRMNRLSLNIGVPNAEFLPAVYPDAYQVIRDSCNTLIYLGNAGYEAWNRERHLTPVDGSFLMSDSCIVSIRGVQPYVDECYNLLEDERYKLANSYY